MSLLLVDANAPRRHEIARHLAAAFDGLHVSHAESREQALNSVAADTLVLVDQALPDALATVSNLVDRHGATVVALSADEQRPNVMAAIRAGACGFIRTTDRAQDLLPAMRVVLDGRIWLPPAINERRSPNRPGYGTWIPTAKEPAEAGLSPRQSTLLRLWIESKSSARIAAALGTTEAVVAGEQADLQRQLDASSRLQLVLNVARMGLRLGWGRL